MLAQTGKLSGFNDTYYSDIYYAEPKLDGIRCIAVYDGSLRLYNRNLTDITARFPEISLHPAARNCILDGEIVCFRPNGTIDFQAVQTRANRLTDIPLSAQIAPAILMVFDIVFLNDAVVQKIPAVRRRELLKEILPPIYIVPALHPADALMAHRGRGEGLMIKARHAPYTPGLRSKHWLKVKWEQEQVVYITRLVPGIGKRATTFGAVRIVDARGNDLGKVGTGFTDQDLAIIKKQFPIPGMIAIKVKYNDVTNAGKLRFPRFTGFTT